MQRVTAPRATKNMHIDTAMHCPYIFSNELIIYLFPVYVNLIYRSYERTAPHKFINDLESYHRSQGIRTANRKKKQSQEEQNRKVFPCIFLFLFFSSLFYSSLGCQVVYQPVTNWYTKHKYMHMIQRWKRKKRQPREAVDFLKI
jgi:hypothetical protein|nr:MAG TPA_asm: hypothetical protein [Bacteriophage sp.]